MTPALAVYGRALATGRPLSVVGSDGSARGLGMARYLGPVDAVDLNVVARCTGPTLDIGCGPGRFVSALLSRGVPALGVDVAPEAVQVARSAGVSVLQRSVFHRLPAEGCWPYVLLLDENVGIGGCPATLLGRVRELLTDGGHVIVEADPDEHIDDRREVRLRERSGRLSRPFRWARLGAVPLMDIASRVGLRTTDSWTLSGRRFVTFARAAG